MTRTSALLGLLGLLGGLACASVPGAAASPSSPCDALAAEYATALAEAQVCDPTASDPCGAVRVRRLEDPCHCLVSVSGASTAKLDALSARWTEQACTVHGFCNRACRAPSRACVGTSGNGARCDGD